MAQKIVKYDPFKKGDTPTFTFKFTEPYDSFDWSAITIDCALTNVQSPTDNSGAAAVRVGQQLTTDSSNNASYSFSITPQESNNLAIDTYYVEAQLKEGTSQVTTPFTGKVDVIQDYVR